MHHLGLGHGPSRVLLGQPNGFCGTPASIVLRGTSFVTTDPAATTTFMPMVTLGTDIAPQLRKHHPK